MNTLFFPSSRPFPTTDVLCAVLISHCELPLLRDTVRERGEHNQYTVSFGDERRTYRIRNRKRDPRFVSGKYEEEDA